MQANSVLESEFTKFYFLWVAHFLTALFFRMYVLIDYGRPYLFTSTCPSLLLKSPLSLVKYPSFNMFNRLANELRPYSAGHYGNSFGFVLETCPKCPPHWMTIMGKRMLGVLLPIAAGVKQIKGFLLLLMETNTAKNGGLSFIGNGELSINFLKPRKKYGHYLVIPFDSSPFLEF